MIGAPPLVRDLVLLGGGHSHAIVARMWGMRPVPGVRVTLVSPESLTPYSGMLPGLVAGHYSREETHIDLVRLCRWAGIRFVRAAASGVDADGRRVLFADRPSIEYDLLSINTGGAPRLDNVPGAAAHAIPVKPVHSFHARWLALETQARDSNAALDIGVVGAGAGGFEILLAADHRLNHAVGGASKGAPRHRLHWLIRGGALAEFPARVRDLALEACARRGIQCHHDFDVTQVGESGVQSARGESLALDATLWCTEAVAASWPSESALECDDRGFIRISDALQSLSHADVFAAGDVAVQVEHPRPRAGVFAVRQGPVLAKNLRRALLGQSLVRHRPQKRFLTLLSMGGRVAIGNRGPLSVHGHWVWRWKHHIDTKFMRRFNDLPPIPEMKSGSLPASLAGMMGADSDGSGVASPGGSAMRCAGCGGKVAGDVLEAVMASLSVCRRDDLPVGLGERGDVAVIDPGGRSLAQSVDQVRAFVDDPWLFARIATVHALSDLYAARCTPQSAMVMVTLPWGQADMMRRELQQLMQGVGVELERAGCALSGGHTSEGETSLGFVVNGYPGDGVAMDKSGAQAGDCLLLTRPLGTGVILAADMQARATGPAVDAAVESMLMDNGAASAILGQHGAHAMTDVTGFGLLGHLLELLRADELGCCLEMPSIPLLPGAAALAAAGIRSTLYPANVRLARAGGFEGDLESVPDAGLLADPQTSGGLLAALPESAASACLDALHEAGYDQAAIIGHVTDIGDSILIS